MATAGHDHQVDLVARGLGPRRVRLGLGPRHDGVVVTGHDELWNPDRHELGRVTEGNIRALPRRFETSAALLGAIATNQRLGRADDYATTLPARLRRLDAAAIDRAARTWLGAEGLTFVVVGDRKLIEPQLKGIDLPIEIAVVDSKPISGE